VRLLAPILIALLVAGCGQASLTVDEYRDQVSDSASAFTAEAEGLRSTHLWQMERAVEGLVRELEGDALEVAAVEETGQRSAAMFAAIADAIDRYALDLSSMIPPRQIGDAHDEYVKALQLSIADIGSTLDALTSAESFDAIDAAVGGSGFNDAQYRVDAACRNLQRLLAEQGAPADLHCRPA
jgi:hypothetical protein